MHQLHHQHQPKILMVNHFLKITNNFDDIPFEDSIFTPFVSFYIKY